MSDFEEFLVFVVVMLMYDKVLTMFFEFYFSKMCNYDCNKCNNVFCRSIRCSYLRNKINKKDDHK